MSVKKRRKLDSKGKWVNVLYVSFVFRHADGRRQRVRKDSPVQTPGGAAEFELQLRQELLAGRYGKEVPTFERWFEGTFRSEWIVGRDNKPGEVESKESIYRNHLGPCFGKMRLDQIDETAIIEFKQRLRQKKLSGKTVNNVLGVLSTALRYAARKRLIPVAPEVGFLRLEPPLFDVWEPGQYLDLLAAAEKFDPTWFAAICLAGEAGLRVGEIKALQWERDVDMIGRSITVNKQTRKGITGSTKGRTRRTVPMTSTLYEALRALNRIRRGYVICNEDGSAKSDNQCTKAGYRLCKLAGLPLRGWHVCRHTFATEGGPVTG